MAHSSDPLAFPDTSSDLFTLRLHLVAGLESAWLPKPRGEPGFCQLESWLAYHPEVCLTLVSALRFDEALALVESHLSVLPLHVVSSKGFVLHHLRDGNEWDVDPSYSEWLNLQQLAEESSLEPLSTAENTPLCAVGIAVEYLEIQWGAPRPLVVFGSVSSEHDLLALADIPVTFGDIPEDLSPSPTHPKHHPPTGNVGRKGLLDLLRSTAAPRVKSWK